MIQNTVVRQAAQGAEMGWLMGVMTAVFLLAFTGFAWWAWRGANRQRLDEDARLPLNDGGER